MNSLSSLDTSLNQFRYKGDSFTVKDNEMLYVTYQDFRGCVNSPFGHVNSLRIKRDSVYADESWVVYSKDGKALITCLKKEGMVNYKVKEGTIVICDCAFDCCDKLSEIVIPDSVQAIGEAAFWGCNSLSSIKLGLHRNDVIQARTFWGCCSLPYINLPESLIRIEEHAFEFCDFLHFVFMAQNVEFVAPNAFESDKYTPLNIIVPNLTNDYYSKLLDGLEVKIKTIEDFRKEQDLLKHKSKRLIPERWSEIVAFFVCTLIGLGVMLLINLLKSCM
ncbi:MAG: leucine-rich repeat domain-containing protein [Prevotella sp.]|nr:leucine-rich repeat domain-containing protein [Prevotella sp.]